MRIRIVSLVLALCAATPVLAQELFGFGIFGGTELSVARIDPATGAATVLFTTDAPSISSAHSAFDPAGRRLFIQDGTRLWTIDLRTQTATSIPFPSCCPHLLFDTVTNQLLGIGIFGGPQISVAAIDPATGATTVLVTTSATSLSSAHPTFDPIQRRVFFLDGTNLVTVNLASSTSSQVALPSCCPHLVYDTVANRLLAIGVFGGAEISIASIDPSTGTANVLLGTGTATLSSAQPAFDAATGRIFFQTSTRLITVNLAASTVNRVVFPFCCPPLFAGALSETIPLLDGFGLLALLAALAVAALIAINRAS